MIPSSFSIGSLLPSYLIKSSHTSAARASVFLTFFISFRTVIFISIIAYSLFSSAISTPCSKDASIENIGFLVCEHSLHLPSHLMSLPLPLSTQHLVSLSLCLAIRFCSRCIDSTNDSSSTSIGISLTVLS